MRFLLTLFAIIVYWQSTQAQTKVVLIEEGTGTWCSWCPRGIVNGHQLNQDYPGQVLQVAIHTNDIMEIDGNGYFNATGLSGLPSGNIDRVSNDVDPNGWASVVALTLQLAPPADVSVSHTYDANTRTVSITVSAQFYSTLAAGDYRLGGIIIEDAVTGEGPAYAQSNSYSGGNNGPMGGWENLPNPMPASKMVYDHVARSLLTDYDGLSGSVPSSPQAGQNYSQNFSYVIPAEYNEDYIRVYGYLTNATTGEVLNAGSSAYTNGDFNAIPFFHSSTTATLQENIAFDIEVLCHDPDDQYLTITDIGNLPSWITVQADGDNDARLVGTPTATGVFNFSLSVSDGNHTRIEDFEIEVNPGTIGWIDVGQPGFSATAAQYNSHIVIDRENDMMYAMGPDVNDQVQVYQFDGSNWQTLGNPIATSALYSELSYNETTDEVWVATSTGFQTETTIVYKYDGNSWVQVGSAVQGYRSLNLLFDDIGTPYLMNVAPDLNFYTFDGTSWNTLPTPTAVDPLAWPRLKLNPNGEFVMLVAEFPGFTGYSRVFTYDGSNWSNMGGRINSSKYTSPSSSSLHDIAIDDNNTIYTMLAHADGSNVYRWNGNAWDTIAVNIDDGIREAFDIVVGKDNEVYVAYLNTSGRGTCKAWQNGNWNLVGTSDFTSNISDVELDIYSDGYPGAVFIDMDQPGGKLSAKRYQVTVSGLDDNMESEVGMLEIHPTIASTSILVSDNKGESTPIQFYDSNGRWIASGMTGTSISVKDWPSGLYMVKSSTAVGRFFVVE